MKAVIVDDEQLALKRFQRLLEKTGRVEIEAAFDDPVEALAHLKATPPDVLFLDIEMPEMSGFDLLGRLQTQPLVVFTTAYDQYALRAFEVNSIDYLVKPVEAAELERALNKLERIRGGAEPAPDVAALIERLSTALASRERAYPTRVASRIGDRTTFVELERVTHFHAKDKLTYAATAAKEYIVDHTIADLEERLDPARFVRIHRSTLLNVNYVKELHSWFGSKLLVRLNDPRGSELIVARDRARQLKKRLGF